MLSVDLERNWTLRRAVVVMPTTEVVTQVPLAIARMSFGMENEFKFVSITRKEH
jgi:hypothetical protein